MSEPLDPDCLGDQSFEDALEPTHLIRRSDVVARAGVMMLGAGTSSLRVRELMRRAARSLGLDDFSASIGYTDITLTVGRRGIFRTRVAETTLPGVNADRIARMQRLSLTMPETITATELDARLDEIEAAPKLYPTWLLVILVALACASISLLTGGGWREIVAVAPASALAYWLHRVLSGWQINHLAVVVTSAFASSALFMAFTAGLDAALGSTSARVAAGFICASIFLIPGFPLVTGGLDLTRIDLTAGIPRIAYAGMVLLAITIGVWLVATLTGIQPDPVPPLAGPAWAVWAASLVASFLAVFGWAMMFNSPWQVAVTSGVIAVLGNLPRLLMLEAGFTNHVATFVACVIIGLLSAVAGRLFGLEKIIMTVPTLLVSIPGSSALRALLYFDDANMDLAVANAASTVMVVIAMVAGLSVARMLTDPEWAFTRPDAPSLVRVVRGRVPNWRRR